MKAKKTKNTEIEMEAMPLLQQKVSLATQAIDLLMFQGEIGNILQPLASMVGLPNLSVGLIFPQKKKDSMQPFLGSLRWIICTALDEQVELEEFTRYLAEAILQIQEVIKEDSK